MEDIKCPECGYVGEPEIIESYEQDDRDGNRGIDITFIECPECGEDLKEVIDDEY